MVLAPKQPTGLREPCTPNQETQGQRSEILSGSSSQRACGSQNKDGMMEKEGMIRVWFSDVKNFDDLEVALSEARSYLEEILLGRNTGKVEIWCVKRLPIQTAAGQTS